MIGNVAASGTEIIQLLGERHQRTGEWIVYTSADSVFQVAAHERTVPLEELYEGSPTARAMLTGDHEVGGVIARPFEGEPGSYAVLPGGTTSGSAAAAQLCNGCGSRGWACTVSGKIGEIFAGSQIDSSPTTESNVQGIARTIDRLRTLPDSSFVFVNLVETDMIWGHRNDPDGFAGCLEEFDEELPRLLAAMRHGDLLLVLTSDHRGSHTPSTDHSREYGLLLAHVAGAPLIGRRHDGDTFADVGATVARHITGRHDRGLPGTRCLIAGRSRSSPESGTVSGLDREQLDLMIGPAASDEQVAALLMAIVLRGMNGRDRGAAGCDARLGERLEWPWPVADKHSTGGVGDKTTLVVAPIVAACGLRVVKMSGRGLGHTGGTLDKLESIPGMRVSLDSAEMLAQVERAGIVVCGPTADLAPADRRVYAVRDHTATVESLPLIATSIMAKKSQPGPPAWNST